MTRRRSDSDGKICALGFRALRIRAVGFRVEGLGLSSETKTRRVLRFSVQCRKFSAWGTTPEP